MAFRECGKGHVYDTDQYAVCPYCNGGRTLMDYDEGGGYDETVVPDDYAIRRRAVKAQKTAQMQRQVQPQPQRNTYEPAPHRRNLNYGADNILQAAEELEKTVAPTNYRRYMKKQEEQEKVEEQEKTAGIFKKQYDLEPVVGWLVCIDGPTKGKDYHLWARINTIGRGEDMDVCLKEDPTISKENHARLAYDPKYNGFQLIPGKNTNNIYLNNKPIYSSVELAPYDAIEFGKSKMVFVPFCSDRFTWTTGLELGL